jgi:hypothetical protein
MRADVRSVLSTDKESGERVALTAAANMLVSEVLGTATLMPGFQSPVGVGPKARLVPLPQYLPAEDKCGQ